MKAGLHRDLPSSLSSLEPFWEFQFSCEIVPLLFFPLGEKHGFMYYTVVFAWQIGFPRPAATLLRSRGKFFASFLFFPLS